VLALRSNQISHITRFGSSAVLGTFGLPRTLCEEGDRPGA
jgi:hypothetical protein